MNSAVDDPFGETQHSGGQHDEDENQEAGYEDGPDFTRDVPIKDLSQSYPLWDDKWVCKQHFRVLKRVVGGILFSFAALTGGL